jgi:hypothetical protein
MPAGEVNGAAASIALDRMEKPSPGIGLEWIELAY